MKLPSWLRKPLTVSTKSRRPKSRWTHMRVEPLEDRITPSTIRWTNRNDFSGATDNRFDDVFGNLAAQAMNVVDATIVQWQRVVESFNYGTGTDEYLLAVYCAAAPLTTGTGVGAGANINPNFVNGKPAAATITINYRATGNSGNVSNGWWLDPTAMDNSEFTGLNADVTSAWVGLPLAPGLGGADFFTGMLHEIGHAMGIYSNAQMNAFATDTGVVDTVNTPASVPPSNFWRFDSPNAHALFTAWNSTGGTGMPGNNANGAEHTAPRGIDPIEQAGRTYYGFADLMNAGFTSRSLITDTHARMLQDAFGYTINLPSRFGTFYDRLDSDGTLTIRTPGDGPDIVELEVIGTDLYVSMTLGSPVVGPDPMGTFTSIFPLGTVNSININTGDGVDRVAISPIPPTIPISVNLGAGVDVLEVNGSAGYDAVTLTASTINSNGSIVSHSNADSITLNTGLGHAGVRISGTILPVTINAFGGDEIIVLHTLNRFGAATINGNGGNDTIIIAPDGGVRDVWGMVTINGGGGNDTINLAPVPLGNGNIDAPVIVNGGTENDTLNLAGGSLDGLAGLVTFDGGGGLDQVVLDDRDFLGHFTYNVNAASITRTPFFAGLNYTDVDTITLNANDGASTVRVGAGVTANLNLSLGDGSDRVFVSPSATSSITLAGDNPTTLPGDALYLDLAANQSVTGTPASGGVSGPGLMPFTYTGFERRVFLTTNTADFGPGSFRQAVLHANGPGPDWIEFDIPGAGVQTITPLTQLPEIGAATTIDGYSQPGSRANTLALGNDAVLRIELSGFNMIGSFGLHITGGGSTVRGLVMNRFANIAIFMQTNAGNTVEGSWMGVSATGNTLLQNGTDIQMQFMPSSPTNFVGGTTPAARNVMAGAGTTGNGGAGAVVVQHGPSVTIQGNYIGVNAQGTARLGIGDIYLTTSDNLVGGTAAGAGNVIGGTLYLAPRFSASDNNMVQGNYFGLTADGTAAIATTNSGILADHAAATSSQGNVIGGTTAAARNVFANSNSPVQLGGAGSNGGFTIQGNYFGLNAAGTAAVLPVRASGNGIAIFNSNNNQIGGAAAGAGNVIANFNVGVAMGGTSAGNVVEGNFIGTNAAGTTAVPNGRGVEIVANGANRVGGVAAGAGNLISGNDFDGIHISVGGGNLIQGNFIGVANDHTTPMPNLGDGIEISGGINNAIGGMAAGTENTIAYNGGDGVFLSGPTGVSSGAGTGNSILRNSIHSNGGLGIDLNADGPNPNDLNDPDTGPNNLQNFPVVTSATTAGGTTTIAGSLNSIASSTFHIEFFSSATADPSGHGEGQTYLGSISVTTDASGNATFTAILPIAVPAGRVVTATATDASGNTSEFSASRPIVVVNSPPVANPDAYTVVEGATLTTTDPNGTVTPGDPKDDGVLANDTDSDGNPLTAILISGPANAASFTLNANGTFTYVHDGSETTSDSFSYKANDGMADSNVVTVTFTITPANDTPVFTSTPITTAMTGVQYGYAVTTADPDAGDSRNITATTLPAWLTLVDNGNGTATLIGTPSSAQVGSHNVQLRVTDAAGAFSIQSFAITVPLGQTPVVNGGGIQRSQVRSIEVTFNTEVTFAGIVAEAFRLSRNGGGSVDFTAVATVVKGRTVVTLSNFSGSETQFGSLADGRFTLTTLADQVSANGQQLANNVNFSLYRFFGDINGDQRVDIADFAAFSQAFLNSSFNPAFDFNNDGRVDIVDFGQFSIRYFTMLP